MAFSLIFGVLLPGSELLAWGAASHMHFNYQFLTGLPAGVYLSSRLLDLLRRHGEAFLYGSFGPDLIIGKKMVPFEWHTHNWKMGLKVLETAKTEEETVYAYGFLSHLAADTIAHNYLAPYKLMTNRTSQNWGHTYWEMLADNYVDPVIWETMARPSFQDQNHLDEFMCGAIERFPFSVKFNKAIFKKVLRVSLLSHRVLGNPVVKMFSRYSMSPEETKLLFYAAIRNIASVIEDPAGSEVLNLSPVGGDIEPEVNMIRKNIRRMIKRGVLTQADYERAFELIHSVCQHTTGANPRRGEERETG